MNYSRNVAVCITIALLIAVAENVVYAEQEHWHDTYYQYRIPVVMSVEKEGWNAVPINEADIIDRINSSEEMRFDPLFFAYNQLKVVEVDSDGNVIAENPDAGFYLIEDGKELIEEPPEDNLDEITIPSEKGSYYLLSYIAEGGGESPMVRYDRISQYGEGQVRSSYEPALLRKKRSTHERLLLSNGDPLKIKLRGELSTDIKKLSLKKVRIAFLANVKKPGTHYWMLYYQPMCGYALTIPRLRHSETPPSTATVQRFAFAEKYLGATQYNLGNNDYFKAWFADSTVKLTPNTPAPTGTPKAITITSAKNEAQSFQVVLAPKKAFAIEGITITDLKQNNHAISSDKSEVFEIEYIPIKKKSYVTPAEYLGKIGDALVAVTSKEIATMQGNHSFFVTVKTPSNTPAGTYTGKFIIQGNQGSLMTIPLELMVYDFELPEFSKLQSSLGGQFFAKPCMGEKLEQKLTIMDYHGLKTKTELKKIAHKYYEIMVKNKFYPKSVVHYSDIGMKWSPPPKGYNVDQPGNYFKLYDWDFTEFNRDLKHYIDDLKVNSVTLVHTNPTTCNRFKHLPGAELEGFAYLPPHSSFAWQTFNERTYVAWDESDGEYFGEKIIEISKDQFDHLVLDFYRTMAKNLEKHGWLDYFYILVDETTDINHSLHFFRLLKSDPLTARIKIIGCMQGLEYLYYKENPEDETYAFNGLLTYVPEDDERYNRWEKYYFEDYDINPDRRNLWNYTIGSARISIDVPGVNNRIIGLDIFNRGGSGYLIWDTFAWDHPYDESKTPWEDPFTRPWGNGVLSYFYPPTRNGLSEKPDYTIIPSLRVMTYRESVEDYDYAIILENLICEGKKKGVDVSGGEKIIKDIDRFFYNSVHWSQNDAWYLDLRDRMAREIVKLNKILNN